MIQWIGELGRVQPNNDSGNEIFVRVGVRGRKLKVGSACSQVVGVFSQAGGGRQGHGMDCLGFSGRIACQRHQ